MEKFAERYVRDNPGKFSSADGAYVLAFAIIMLNTDAHNPLAERRLGKADFVAMNSQPAAAAPPTASPSSSPTPHAEGGAAAPPPSSVLAYELVLPAEELEGIYDRIVRCVGAGVVAGGQGCTGRLHLRSHRPGCKGVRGGGDVQG